jgi:FtsH-binding integral membrane protein
MIGVNIALMPILALTPIPQLVSWLFNFLFVGVIVFGAILTAGTYLSEKGIEQDDVVKLWSGIGLLMVGYGAFGSLALSYLSSGLWLEVVGIATIVSMLIAGLAALYVYNTSRDLEPFRTYASYAFIGVLIISFIGSFSGIFALIAFFLALIGFLLYLVYEIGRLQTAPENVFRNAVGIYSAFMGVFVHILRIVVSMYARRR